MRLYAYVHGHNIPSYIHSCVRASFGRHVKVVLARDFSRYKAVILRAIYEYRFEVPTSASPLLRVALPRDHFGFHC